MTDAASASRAKPLGFWACWALTVGTMIGSGIFSLPAVLAPHGLLSFGGWVLSALGSICLALALGRLAARTTRSGGPFVYARDTFGDLTGFLTGWGHWASFWIAIPAVAVAFVGYVPVFFPALVNNMLAQGLVALALIWFVTLINVRGLREAGATQLVMTLLKIVPILLVTGLGFVTGSAANLPAINPAGAAVLPTLAACVMLTTWAFSGLEAGCMAAGQVEAPERTIPRAVVLGTITVAVIYIAATAAIMLLLPPETLAKSTSPFADAAVGLGAWGPPLVAAGALIATAGALNGVVFVAGQIPMAVAVDGLAPRTFAQMNRGGSPAFALIVSAVLGSLLLAANYTRGLIGAFTFLLTMSILAQLVPMLVSSAAEFWRSRKASAGWATVALAAGGYTLVALIGSGWEAFAWGALLVLAGLPFYYIGRARAARLATSTP
jgi:APA family basic amino acid/polyamine antiporter